MSRLQIPAHIIFVLTDQKGVWRVLPYTKYLYIMIVKFSKYCWICQQCWKSTIYNTCYLIFQKLPKNLKTPNFKLLVIFMLMWPYIVSTNICILKTIISQIVFRAHVNDQLHAQISDNENLKILEPKQLLLLLGH